MRSRRRAPALVVASLALALSAVLWPAISRAGAPVFLPPAAITADQLGVVVNDADPASVEIGAYYVAKRGIPADQVVHLSFAPNRASLGADEFRALKAQVDAAVPARVQAFALAWTEPYRVDCMSVTAAFAFGFDTAFCADTCRLTKASRYYDSDAGEPFKALGIRPAMLLASETVAETKALIDRGVRSDFTWPQGSAYLLSTSDRDRNVRAGAYAPIEQLLGSTLRIETVFADMLRDRDDVMFYFTGLSQVAALETDRFLDGAIADHLTSSGGVLVGSPQMSALAWLKAGATGSYGTAFEPCSFARKFPNPGVVIARYIVGETLIEAYWKSVQMPGQGVFVGEPLARPYGGVRTRVVASGNGSVFEVKIRALRPGRYVLQAAPGAIGPFRDVGATFVRDFSEQTLRLPATPAQVYRLVAVGAK